jgi:hypothetical protein
LCQNSATEKVTFSLSKQNILFVSVPDRLYAATLDDCLPSSDIQSYRGNYGGEDAGDVYIFGPKTRYGSLQFESDFRLLLTYDTEISFNDDEDDNSVIGLFEKRSQLDFNKIVCTEN